MANTPVPIIIANHEAGNSLMKVLKDFTKRLIKKHYLKFWDGKDIQSSIERIIATQFNSEYRYTIKCSFAEKLIPHNVILFV